MEDSGEIKAGKQAFWYWAALVLIIAGSAVIRWRLASMPLERDEGEYAYIAQQMLKGVPPYESAYSMKLPGIYAVYALFLAVFGQTIEAIHTGLIIFNSATIFVIFLLAKRLFDGATAVVTAAAFGTMSLGEPVLGLTANAEHFVVLPALSGILLLARPAERRGLLVVFAAAFLLGLAFIIKQHGIFFALFAAFYLLYCDLRSRPFQPAKTILTQLIFISGAAAPFAIVCFLYQRIGLFDKFWFWTFTYAGKYVTLTPLAWLPVRFQEQFAPVVRFTAPVLLFALAGILSLLLEDQIRKNAFFVIGLFVFSFLSVCPGFYFRKHYFIFLLPAVSILAGAGFCVFCRRAAGPGYGLKRGFVCLLTGFIIIGYSLFDQRTYLFDNDATKVCRKIYSSNPFPESIEIAKYIKQKSCGDDTIAVIGSEPQIYFYSDRRAATRYLYTFPLLERHNFVEDMQKEMIVEIEAARPEFMVFALVWLIRSDYMKPIFDWYDAYASRYYDVVGIVDILFDGRTVYRWDAEVAGYQPKSKSCVVIFRRKH